VTFDSLLWKSRLDSWFCSRCCFNTNFLRSSSLYIELVSATGCFSTDMRFGRV